MTEQRPDAPDLGQVLGMGGEELRARLGTPTSERAVGGDCWLVYSAPAGRLRVRLSASRREDTRTVSSWTYEPRDGAPSLGPLVESLGLALAGSADSPPESGGRLMRAEIEGETPAASLTATVRDGRIVSVTAFDEAPDWRGRQ